MANDVKTPTVCRPTPRGRLALGAKLCSLGCGSALELVELVLVAADPERGDNLHHPDDDQPDADHECQCDERIERIPQHDDAGEDRDDAEEDRPSPSWQVRVTDCGYGRCDAAEDEPDTDPNGQQQNRITLAKVPEGQNRQYQRCRAANEQQDPAGRGDREAECEDHLRHTTNHQIDAEKNRSNDDRFPRPEQNQHSQGDRQQSGDQCGLPQMMQQTWAWLVNVSHNQPLSQPDRKPGRTRFVLCPSGAADPRSSHWRPHRRAWPSSLMGLGSQDTPGSTV